MFGHKLGAGTVHEIQKKYADKIRKKRDELLSPEGLKSCPLLNRRVRVEILMDVIESGLQERVVGTYTQVSAESGEKEVLPIIKQDLNSVLIALRACKDEDLGFEELAIKRSKRPPDDGDYTGEIEVNSAVG